MELTTKDIASLEWWTIRELAERWRTSTDTIRRMIGDGKLKAMTLGGSYRIHCDEIRRHEQQAHPEKSKRRQPTKISPELLSAVGTL